MTAIFGAALALLLTLSTIASAQKITGTVTNGTTGKPAAGDTVALLALSQGMQEVASTKSDAQGKFTLPAQADQQAPHMVRVTHGGVNYFPQGGPLMPGGTTADFTVYDTGEKVEGISQTVEVDRYQTDGGNLQVIGLFALNNASNPPRTVGGDHTFEFVLPAGAQLDSVYAKGPGGQPVSAAATPTSQKNHYALSYPVRPGETQFQVLYHMPYSGDASFSPKALTNIQHFVVMTPTGMTFEAKDPKLFKAMPDKSGSGVMVVTDVKAGQELSFRISGSGTFKEEQEAQGGESGDSGGGGATGGGRAAGRDNRPGGGLGAPIDAPDPLHDYRAYILGVFALVLVMGGFYVVAKTNQQSPVATAGAPPVGSKATYDAVDAAAYEEPVAPAPAPRDRSALLLEAMKEELFQLEVDRAQSKISQPEYEKAKAALDETIRRALARKGS
jgi:catechol 2,3-dioxygenase-like lactoylglutathione lyase family enzyme